MTNKEFLINQLAEGFPSITKEAVQEIYKMINEKDWKDFCSQMGDYDHPEERRQAEKELAEKKEKFIAGNSVLASAFDNIQNRLNSRDNEDGKFYAEHFHSMNEEYIA